MKSLTIQEVEELTNSIHEPCDPKDLPFPEEEAKWVQMTIDDILKAEEEPKKSKPVFSDDFWDEVEDMLEEWLIINR